MQSFSTKKLQDRVLVKLFVFWAVFLSINSYKTSSRSLKQTCWSLFRWLLQRSFLSPPDCLQFQQRLNLVVLFSSFCMIFPSINLKWDIDRLAALLLWSLKHLSILNHCQQLQVDCYCLFIIWYYQVYILLLNNKLKVHKSIHFFPATIYSLMKFRNSKSKKETASFESEPGQDNWANFSA